MCIKFENQASSMALQRNHGFCMSFSKVFVSLSFLTAAYTLRVHVLNLVHVPTLQ